MTRGKKNEGDAVNTGTDAASGTEAANGNGDEKPKVVESKADKFRRLANVRLAKAEKVLRSVANLAVKSQYTYTDEQRDIVIGVIIKATNAVVAAYKPEMGKAETAASYV